MEKRSESTASVGRKGIYRGGGSRNTNRNKFATERESNTLETEVTGLNTRNDNTEAYTTTDIGTSKEFMNVEYQSDSSNAEDRDYIFDGAGDTDNSVCVCM